MTTSKSSCSGKRRRAFALARLSWRFGSRLVCGVLTLDALDDYSIFFSHLHRRGKASFEGVPSVGCEYAGTSNCAQKKECCYDNGEEDSHPDENRQADVEGGSSIAPEVEVWTDRRHGVRRDDCHLNDEAEVVGEKELGLKQILVKSCVQFGICQYSG